MDKEIRPNPREELKGFESNKEISPANSKEELIKIFIELATEVNKFNEKAADAKIKIEGLSELYTEIRNVDQADQIKERIKEIQSKIEGIREEMRSLSEEIKEIDLNVSNVDNKTFSEISLENSEETPAEESKEQEGQESEIGIETSDSVAASQKTLERLDDLMGPIEEVDKKEDSEEEIYSENYPDTADKNQIIHDLKRFDSSKSNLAYETGLIESALKLKDKEVFTDFFLNFPSFSEENKDKIIDVITEKENREGILLYLMGNIHECSDKSKEKVFKRIFEEKNSDEIFYLSLRASSFSKENQIKLLEFEKEKNHNLTPPFLKNFSQESINDFFKEMEQSEDEKSIIKFVTESENKQILHKYIENNSFSSENKDKLVRAALKLKDKDLLEDLVSSAHQFSEEVKSEIVIGAIELNNKDVLKKIIHSMDQFSKEDRIRIAMSSAELKDLDLFNELITVCENNPNLIESRFLKSIKYKKILTAETESERRNTKEEELLKKVKQTIGDTKIETVNPLEGSTEDPTIETSSLEDFIKDPTEDIAADKIS